MFFEEGELKKMTITALTYADGRPMTDLTDEEKTYTVQVNPATFSMSKQIHYDNHTPPGNSETNQEFRGSGPTTLSFEIIFDGTGAVINESMLGQIPAVGAIASLFGSEDVFDVHEQIEKFEKVVYKFDGTIHQPNKLKIEWGKLIFECGISSVSYTYTLFKPDGSPLRAKANCSFVKTVAPQQQAADQNTNSPDLTHVRDFKEGDTLPLLAQRIYGNPTLYLEVARVNKLINFRRIEAGQRISLPPIDKSNSK